MRLPMSFVVVLAFFVAASPAAADPIWDRLRTGGQVVILRHAIAPGTGDPANFDVADCTTQRNLSEEGREQARRIGERFRAEGVKITRVLTSAWCRCVDTARFAFGAADIWPPLNSVFRDRSTEPDQTDAVRGEVAAWSGPGTLVLVTHQVNITALTNIFPRSGEAVVLTPSNGGFTVDGRLPF